MFDLFAGSRQGFILGVDILLLYLSAGRQEAITEDAGEIETTGLHLKGQKKRVNREKQGTVDWTPASEQRLKKKSLITAFL